MSHFYGTIKGQAKTTATRRGSPASGLITTTNGWDCGVTVEATLRENDLDTFKITLTGGSHAERTPIVLGTYFLDPFTGEPYLVVSNDGRNLIV